jgi:putative toxin-antitoxin system antitoxin component (TIGR02293 family)
MLVDVTTSPTARANALAALYSIFSDSLGGDDREVKVGGARRAQKGASGEFRSVLLSAGGIHNKVAYRIVKHGIPGRSLLPFGEYLGLGKGAVAEFLDLDRTTAHRKVSKDEPLPMHAAETMLRLLDLSNLAEDTLATPEEAAAWLRRPHPMLDGEAPLECAKSAFGAQRVKDMLIAMKYGGVV